MTTAIDRNVWQYLTDATRGAYDAALDASKLREERVAALRIALYAPTPLWITPSVHAEFERIGDLTVANANAGMLNVFLCEAQARDLDPVTVALRVTTLFPYHKDPDDCRAVAEAEMASVTRLLTFDDQLIKRLSPHTGVTLTTPSAYWQALAAPRSAVPRIAPASTNPLSTQTWWRW